MDVLFLQVAGWLVVVISLLNLFGILERQWFVQRISKVTLLLLGFVMIFVAFRIPEYSDSIKEKIQKSESEIKRAIESSESSNTVEVLRLENTTEAYGYIANKIRTAKESIDDITWGSRKDHRSETEKNAYNDYLKAMEEACQKPNITYREISSLTDDHYFSRADKLVQKKYFNYNLGYYDISKTDIPLMSYIIFDSKEVIVGFYRVPLLPSRGEIYLSIKDPNILALLNDYYETLWKGTVKLKVGDTTNIARLDSIKARITVYKVEKE